MPKEEVSVFEGKVTDALANTQFRVVLDNGYAILCHISGKMRKNFIKVLPGDRVEVEVSSYDMTKGRITRRAR